MPSTSDADSRRPTIREAMGDAPGSCPTPMAASRCDTPLSVSTPALSPIDGTEPGRYRELGAVGVVSFAPASPSASSAAAPFSDEHRGADHTLLVGSSTALSHATKSAMTSKW